MSVNLETFLLERLKSLDPGLDVSPNSPAYVHVIQPMLARLGTDPFETDIRAFILARMEEEFPEYDVKSRGSALLDLLVNPMQLMLAPLQREIGRLGIVQSLNNADLMTEEESDHLLSNFFVTRQPGSRAIGTARVYFDTPRTLDIDSYVYFTNAMGGRYRPINVETFTSNQMALNYENGLYFADIAIEAEEVGDLGNIPSGGIVSVTGMADAYRVTNMLPLAGGTTKENTTQFFNRVENLISERSPTTKAGILSGIYEDFSSVRAAQVIGFGDPEMQRDVIKGTVTLDENLLGMSAQEVNESDGVAETHELSFEGKPNLSLTKITNVLSSAEHPFVAADVGKLVQVKQRLRRVVGTNDGNAILADYTVLGTGILATAPHKNGLIGSYGSVTVKEIEGEQNIGPLLPYASRVKIQSDGVIEVPGVLPGDILVLAAPMAHPPSDIVSTYWRVKSVSGDDVVVRPDPTDMVIGLGGGYNKNQVRTVATSETVLTIELDPDSDFDFESMSFGDDMPQADDEDLQFSGKWFIYREGTSWWRVPLSKKVNARTLEARRDLGTRIDWTSGSAEAFGDPDEYPCNWTMLYESEIADYEASDPLYMTKYVRLSATPTRFAVLRPHTISEDEDDALGDFAYLDPAVDTSLPYILGTATTLDSVAASVNLTLEDVPFGIPFPDTLYTPEKLKNDEVHVGGCTDVLLHEAYVSPRSMVIKAIDQEPRASGIDLVAAAGSYNSQADGFAGAEISTEAALVITETGSNEKGSYRVTAHGGTTTLTTEHLFGSSVSGQSYFVTEQIYFDLEDPREFLVTTRTGLDTLLHSTKIVDTGIDFSAAGVKVGDTLDILLGENKGKYTITVVKTNELRVLETKKPKASGNNQQYQIYKRHSKISVPFRRVNKVGLLGDTGQSLGIDVPYGKPVDVRVQALTNIGQGTKLSGTISSTADSGETVNDIDVTTFYSDVVTGDILTIENGDAAGNYVIRSITGESQVELYKNRPVLSQIAGDDIAADDHIRYSIGSPSTGTLRTYFLDRTYVEFSYSTVFSTPDGKRYRPDYALDGAVYAVSGTTSGAFYQTTTYDRINVPGVDFVELGVRPDDLLTIKTKALRLEVISTDSAHYAGLEFKFTIGSSPTVTVPILKVDDDTEMDDSDYPGGVATQLDRALSNVKVAWDSDAEALVLYSTEQITVEDSSVHKKYDNVDVGDDNTTAEAQTYRIKGVTSKDAKDDSIIFEVMESSESLPVAATEDLLFTITREGTQVFFPAQMVAENGIYYVDVEVRSEASGNAFNLPDGTQLTVSGEKAKGWWLSTRNASLTYSPTEKTIFYSTPTIHDPELPDGTMMVVAGKQLEIEHEYLPVVDTVQSTLLSDSSRCVNNNVLVRSMFPAYIRMSIRYNGGSQPAIIKQDILDYIDNLQPSTPLSVGNIHAILVRRGATRVITPLEILAITHHADRSISVERTKDRLNLGRLYKMIADPDYIVLTRDA